MDHEQFYVVELLGLLIGSGLVVGAAFLSSDAVPQSSIKGPQVMGQGAIAIASLMIIFSIYFFRESLDPPVFHLFFHGFAFLYLSTLIDFMSEFRSIPATIHPIQGLMSVLGAASLVGAFGYWLNKYENRGAKLTETEGELSQRTDQLTLLNRVIQHDIRNDLNVINGRIQIAEQYVEPDGETHLSKARQSVNEAIELTETASDFMETLNQDDADFEPVLLIETIQSQIARVKDSHPDATIQFETPPSQEMTIRADEMIDSVFRNLLVNAIFHNNKPTPEITVSIEETDDSVQVRVADNGPGIPDEQKDEVFGQGEKGLESSGTGIGLYLVYTLTTSYGGAVWVEDNEPEGSIFVVELPRYEG